MQPQLKSDSRSLLVWQALAFAFSASALTLLLCAKPTQSSAEPLPKTAAALDAPPPPSSQLELLSQVHALREDGSDAALSSLIAITERAEPRLSRAAFEGIAQIGGDRAREFLVHRFETADAETLPALALALATLGDAAARAVLQSAAQSNRPMTRSAAFDALSTLDSADVREFMLRALGFGDPSPAAEYFSSGRDPRALPALERLARRGDVQLRRLALDALLAQGASAEPALLGLLREDDELCDALLGGQPSTPPLRRALRRASIERLRAGALTSGPVFDFLQRDLSPAALEALLQAARDPGSRDAALSALSQRADNGSLRALSTLADDADRELSARAACVLLSRPDSRSRPFLLRSNRRDLTSETAEALSRINAPGARPI